MIDTTANIITVSRDSILKEIAEGSRVKIEDPFHVHDYSMATPEQRVAIKYANDNGYPIEILAEVAASIPQTVPNGSDKGGWGYGACRRICTIGGCTIGQFEDGSAPKDVDLTDIKYFGFYRQAVKNKHTGELKGFAAIVGSNTFTGEVEPGQEIEVKGEVIRHGWNREDVEKAARESFLRLQELCEEFYNREREDGNI